ncbi:ARF-binding protein [Savitreella phatthalungensis]
MVSLDEVSAYQPTRSIPKSQAHLYSYINRATSPANFEPNLSLNLEIADLINSKKGNMPRDAAVALVHKINSLNPVTSLLAIALLDMLVKNCGYPFHLQIATKEFLNELVRRFPERPPPQPSRVQFRILELLEQWRQTLCETSRYKDDMGYIRDMHRLLHYKGYDFPQINASAADVLNPNDSLKSATEMEEEDRVAHSAKLQELIRRGTPADLAEANRLMKVMAGFDQHKIDYRAKAAAEVDQIRRKAALLSEMLSGLSASDVLTEGDIYQELADSIRNAQPKLRKMCEDESEDQNAVSTLFQLNDSINNVVHKYDLLKKGDFGAASQVSTNVPETNISDVLGAGDSAEPVAASATTSAATTQSKFAQDINLLDFDGPSDMPAALSQSTQATSTTSPSQATTSAAKSTQKQSEMDDLLGLNFGGLDTFGSSGSIALGGQSASQTTSAQSTTLANSFAGLNMQSSSSAPLGGQRIELFQSNSVSVILVKGTGTGTQANPLNLTALFSNRSSSALNDIELQIAVPKSQQIQMQPPSSKTIASRATDAIKQTMTLSGVSAGQAKLRYKLSYTSNGAPAEESGQIQFAI